MFATHEQHYHQGIAYYGDHNEDGRQLVGLGVGGWEGVNSGEGGMGCGGDGGEVAGQRRSGGRTVRVGRF